MLIAEKMVTAFMYCCGSICMYSEHSVTITVAPLQVIIHFPRLSPQRPSESNLVIPSHPVCVFNIQPLSARTRRQKHTHSSSLSCVSSRKTSRKLQTHKAPPPSKFSSFLPTRSSGFPTHTDYCRLHPTPNCSSPPSSPRMGRKQLPPYQTRPNKVSSGV